MKRKLLYGCLGLLVGGGALLGALAAVGSSLDDELSLHAESLLTAPPEALYATLTTRDALVAWWGQTGDPAAGRTVRAAPGPAAGVGMQIEVLTDGSVSEQWVLTAAEPPGLVRYTVDLQGFTVERTITLTASGSGTWATWDDLGMLESPFMRFFTLLPEDVLLSVPYTALTSLDAASQ